jgi:hypothetical protein
VLLVAFCERERWFFIRGGEEDGGAIDPDRAEPLDRVGTLRDGRREEVVGRCAAASVRWMDLYRSEACASVNGFT